MYQIRQATVDDVETIRQIAEKTWRPAYSQILTAGQISFMLDEIYAAEKIAAQIAGNLQAYLLLMEDERPVAFAACSPHGEEPGIYKLHKLYCLPAAQGKGYGRILIQEACKKAIEAGKHALELNVNRYNKAKDFYEKLGFKVLYEEDIPIGPYFMNDYVMQKDLT